MGLYHGPTPGWIAKNRFVIASGLVLNLDAGNSSSYSGSGSTWTDISGSNNNFTLFNSPTFTTNYLTFNGTSQYAQFASTSTLSLSSVSIFMWVYPVSDGIFAEVLGQQTINTSYHHAAIDITSGGVFRTGLWNGSSVSYSSSSAISFNNWYNIGLTFSGTTLTGYLNGVSIGSPAGFAWSAPPTFYLGICGTDSTTISGGTSAYGDGRVGTTILYNRALTADEVLQNYNTLRSRFGL